VDASTTTSPGVSDRASFSNGSLVFLLFLLKKFLICGAALTRVFMGFIVHMTFNCHYTHVAERYINSA